MAPRGILGRPPNRPHGWGGVPSFSDLLRLATSCDITHLCAEGGPLQTAPHAGIVRNEQMQGDGHPKPIPGALKHVQLAKLPRLANFLVLERFRGFRLRFLQRGVDPARAPREIYCKTIFYLDANPNIDRKQAKICSTSKKTCFSKIRNGLPIRAGE